MHLYFFLVVIVSLSCGSLPQGDVDPVAAGLATAAMVTAWVILSHVAARTVALYVRDEKLQPLAGAEWLEKQLAAFRWIGLAVTVLCLAGFGLARSTDEIPFVADSMFLQAILLMLPGIAITAGTWSAEHRYGVLLSYTGAGIGNHVRSVWQSFRGGMAWLVAPVLLLLGLSDLIALLPISTTAANVTTVITIVSFVLLGLPWMIRHLFKTGPLDPAAATWVNQLMFSAGARRTRAVRWNTAGTTFNAMIAGFVPPLRTLLLSDRLVDELPRPQIAMVVLHEAAHLRRRHVPMRMLAVLPAWGAGALISRIAGEQSWSLAAGSVVGILLTMLILRIVAYRTEFDADVQACRMAAAISQGQSPVEDVPATYDEAADALAAALMRVTFDHPANRKPTWLHPGVMERIDWMKSQSETAPTTSALSDRDPITSAGRTSEGPIIHSINAASRHANPHSNGSLIDPV
ncbi:Peptidase family M48 [Rubripirellula lacrimiformis]|uniref:Peptidase family M48 n=1 Tax=Rubripirellula lacrimiformis TaxID=1930273 RepID=A0A517NFZ2_9BACT|nr:M48 family metalloprotease [Rubripirellula lacrimiformis]QDT06045.1 Peptidase family M48 [Rubripirellula lacrimiformis]